MNINTIVNIDEEQLITNIESNILYKGMGRQTYDLLKAFNSGEEVSIFDFSIEEARALFNPIFQSSSGPLIEVAQEDHKIIQHNQNSVPIIELTPKGEMPSEGWPLLLFIHGGGWILGNYPSYEGIAKSCCEYTKAKIIFVEYSLSPEAKYPHALNQVIATLSWVKNHHKALNINPNRIGVVGDSAGGNLAAALCLSNQKFREPLPIKIQCLLYPLIDLSVNANYPSRKIYGNGEFFLSRDHIVWSRNHYLTKQTQSEEILVSPQKAKYFKDLPESIIVAAGFDPLQDEATAYHHKLTHFGNKSLLLRFTSTIHGFLSFSANLDIANIGIKRICNEIRERI